MVNDPVCGITLDNKAPCKSTHAGRVYVFCCLTCKTKFDKEPGQYGAHAAFAPAGLRPPPTPSASRFLITSLSIRRLLPDILLKLLSNETQGRPTWITARGRSWDRS
jgi:YHS domain-containing protein